MGMLKTDSRNLRVCDCHDMKDKVRGSTVESGHGRKPIGNMMLSLTKEVEILVFELLYFRRLCISWGQKLVVPPIH